MLNVRVGVNCMYVCMWYLKVPVCVIFLITVQYIQIHLFKMMINTLIKLEEEVY